MELKGQVILDEETMSKLKEQIREEVINEIKEYGNYSSEIIAYMNDCEYKGYIWLIENTINNIIAKTNKDKDVTFSSDLKAYNRILAIKTILEI